MSKLACRCGNTISNTMCPSPTEGWLTGDQDYDRLLPEAFEAVKGFIAALLAGRKEAWIRSFFLPEYPADLADESVISDVLAVFERRYQKSVAECDQCGRLLVQLRAGENAYRSYAPDEGGYAGVLRGSRAAQAARPGGAGR